MLEALKKQALAQEGKVCKHGMRVGIIGWWKCFSRDDRWEGEVGLFGCSLTERTYCHRLLRVLRVCRVRVQDLSEFWTDFGWFWSCEIPPVAIPFVGSLILANLLRGRGGGDGA